MQFWLLMAVGDPEFVASVVGKTMDRPATARI